MIKEFRNFNVVDIEAMLEYVDDFIETLRFIHDEEIRDEGGFSRSDLTALLTSLVQGQRESLGRTKPGSWAVVPDDADMPSDARVDFIFKPTYVGVAILSLAIQRYPIECLSIPGLLDALKKGMEFSTYRELGGHGYEFTEGQLETISIFGLGQVPELLRNNPTLCPKLLEIIANVYDQMTHALKTGNTHSLWGTDYREDFLAAVESLHILADPNNLDIITKSSDDDFVAEGDIEW